MTHSQAIADMLHTMKLTIDQINEIAASERSIDRMAALTRISESLRRKVEVIHTETKIRPRKAEHTTEGLFQ